jgi:hypothetical protein
MKKMNNKRYKRILIIVACISASLAAAAFIALRLSSLALKSRIEQALGPQSEVAEIAVGWSAIEIRGIRIRAPQGWPAPDALRAERVVIRPDLFALLSARLHVPRIVIENAYVSVWRAPDGTLRLLPGLLERSTQDGAPAPELSIGHIELTHGALEFFDSTIRRPAHKTRLEQLHASVDGLHLPSLTGRTALKLDGAVKGVRRDGRLLIDGWAELAARNSEIATKLHGVDLVALQPYLIKASETGVRRGTLDMRLKSVVRNNRLRAPGSITLSGLELAPGDGALATFMGVPRNAVMAALKNSNGQIAVDFTLDGDLDDPRFSLNDSFAHRLGTGLAEGLGISIEGLTRGVGGAANSIGGVVKKLFGQ